MLRFKIFVILLILQTVLYQLQKDEIIETTNTTSENLKNEEKNISSTTTTTIEPRQSISMKNNEKVLLSELSTESVFDKNKMKYYMRTN